MDTDDVQTNASIIANDIQPTLDYEQWLEQYKPVTNPFCVAPFDGKMYETFGKELDHVHKVLENGKNFIWTYIDSDGHSSIIPGYHHINRLGYFITEIAWQDERLSVEVD
jgi:hypothetical protein